MPVEIGRAPPLFREHEAARVLDVAIDLVADAAFFAQRRVDDAPEELFQFLFKAGFATKTATTNKVMAVPVREKPISLT